jgi:nitrogen regulatory protein PII
LKPCKRIEIVIEQPLARRVAALMDSLDVPGYSIVQQVSGRGDRGARQAEEVSGADTNCLFLIACDDDALTERIVEHVRPILRRSGGMCIVSEALWVRH